MTFQLTTFQGVRPALFHYNTSGEPGGYADFDNFTVEEPRARGIEREIPLGKTVVFISGADGNLLNGDDTLVIAPGPAESGASPASAAFFVVDRGLGRVALRKGGKFV